VRNILKETYKDPLFGTKVERMRIVGDLDIKGLLYAFLKNLKA
jgi:hypothetical protein